MRISYSAPAKVTLSGEHAVVYGKPAIVAALDLRLTFSSWESKKNIDDPTMRLISQKVQNYLTKQDITFQKKNFEYKIVSDIPQGVGFGSSAALSVASVAALLKFYTGREFEKEVINNITYSIEKYFHTNPSGMDNSASCYGGLIYYRKEFEFLKNIAALAFKIPKKIEENLYLVDGGKRTESTAEMVQYVGKLYNKNPAKIEKVLNNIEKITKKLVVSIVGENTQLFAHTVVENQRLLETLGVVSPKTKKILSLLSKFGVGKVTGAGGRKEGSGYLLFFADDASGLKKYLNKNKIHYIKFTRDFEGVKAL